MGWGQDIIDPREGRADVFGQTLGQYKIPEESSAGGVGSVLGWAAVWLLVAACCGLGQTGDSSQRALVVRTPGVAYWEAKKIAAVTDLVGAFNQIASHAGELRSGMKVRDAEAFDAVMLDMMGALAAIPEIGISDSGGRDVIRPREPRPDRVSQLQPDMAGLVQFFKRLQNDSGGSSARGRFATAEKQARKMLAALPVVLPTLDGGQARH
jgi:hypothetical protein